MSGKNKTIRIANHPVLSKKWDYNNNNENPANYSIKNSTRKFMWICNKCKKTYSSTPRDVQRTGLCPSCAYKEGARKRLEKKLQKGEKTSIADDAFLSKYWAADLNSDNPTMISNKADSKYMWYCPLCGIPFLRRVVYMKNGSGFCKKCSHKIATEKHEAMMLVNSTPVAKIPKLMKSWDVKNNILDPNKISFGSEKIAYWICEKCNKSYPRKISAQYRGTYLCKECATKQGNEKHRKNMAIYNETVADKPNMIALWDWNQNTRNPYDLSAKSGIEV